MNKTFYKDRKNTHSRKWDGCKERFGTEDLLPLWIADMDFEAPECVKKALKKYVDFGVFGYHIPPQEYYDAFINWEKTYHNYQVEQEWIRFAPGVVPAINWLLHILSKENDGILILTPVYYPFQEAAANNGRRLVECPLKRTADSYEIDFEDFEDKIVQNDVKVCIFCSPHNPVGRVWKADEITNVLDICRRHGVYVLSDEIHQDIIMSGYTQITAAALGDYDDILITLTAATKTFNLAACQNSILVIPDKELRRLYDEYLIRLRITVGNSFGYVAVQSTYEGGKEWLKEVLEIIEDNYWYIKRRLEEALPEVWIPELQGTYLMWIDLGKYILSHEMEYVIQERCGLAVDYGAWFGGDEHNGCLRINLATKKENIQLAADRIIRALKSEESISEHE